MFGNIATKSKGLKCDRVFPSLKYELRELKARVRCFFSRFCVWRWRHFSFQIGKACVHYTGRRVHLPLLKSLLGVSPGTDSSDVELHKVSVYEFPVPNALRVPHVLSTVVYLDKPIEAILASYSKSLRRSISKLAPKFSYQKVTTEGAIEEINQSMLMPYATARNGERANQVPLSIVKDMALNIYGQLDILYQGDECVGCHLGNAFTRRGKRYWHVNRFGYINDVFSDYARLQEANSVNLHLALVHAIENGYDYCDYGPSLARPGAGLIEWKRRRKGFLVKASSDSFYIKVSDKNAARFFWVSPLFSLKGEEVNLHLGLPDNKTDEELFARYREMGYDGLTKVYLMCTKQPSDAFIEMVNNLYKDLRFHPDVVVNLAT